MDRSSPTIIKESYKAKGRHREQFWWPPPVAVRQIEERGQRDHFDNSGAMNINIKGLVTLGKKIIISTSHTYFVGLEKGGIPQLNWRDWQCKLE